jgi:energy-coupling factor transport system permease protein
MRFFPLLFTEIRKIIEAQQLRGLAIEKLGIVKKITLYSKIAVPLILGALLKTQLMDIVLQSKAFDGSSDRTYLHESKLTRTDNIIIVCSLVLFTLMIYAYVVWDFGKFRGPV